MADRIFVLPDPGEGLTEAVINEWLVTVGQEVELNQPIAEVETAKATVEIPSPYAGRIAILHAPAGATVPVGAPLVTFDVEPASENAVKAPSRSQPAAATPAVRRLAKDLGVDLASVEGTGPGGRVTAEDVRRAGMSPAPESEVERIPVSPTRASLAANLERQAAIPQVTTFRTLDCKALEDLRRRIQVSPLPIVVAALTRTIAEHSTLNASWGGNEILIHRSVDVGIAVDTGRGLLVPVLRRAQAKGIEDLSREISRLAEGARRGTLDVRDLSGATVAVTNTGSYGSEAGTPMLAPGTAVTLGIGVIEQRALVIEGAVAARPACTLSLTFDHRVLDGATVGRALTDLVERLSSEERLEELPL